MRRRPARLQALVLLLAVGGARFSLGAAAPATVYYNAHVFTAEPDHPYAQAVAVRDGQIAAVGTRDAVLQEAGADALRIDLEGRFLMPGMIDAHAHPIAGGQRLGMARFPAPAGSVDALVQFVRQTRAGGSSRLGDVLAIYEIDLGYWLHLEEIDAALSSGAEGSTPIVLFGSDGHTAWANRAARARAGIDARFVRRLPADQRTYYGTDRDSNPNGFVVDVGKHKLDLSLPAPTAGDLLAAGQRAVHYMNSVGLTGWLEPAVSGTIGGTVPLDADSPGYLPVYRALSERGELTAHVAAYAVVRPAAGLSQIKELQALQARYRGLENFSLVGLKVFADGVVESPSQTALLSQPYRNSNRRTPELYTREQMAALVTEADRLGLGVHVHTIGDLALKNTLDAFAAARAAHPRGSRPFVVTHVQLADPADLPRFAQLNVIAAMQLLWAAADPTTIDPVQPFIDPAIYPWMYSARAILEAGGLVAGASDWPVSSANPFWAICQAETRAGPRGVLNAGQRMPREAMLYAYTRNAARALGQLETIGSIARGKRADLVLVDRDVLTVPADELRSARILWTLFGGRQVFSADTNGP